MAKAVTGVFKDRAYELYSRRPRLVHAAITILYVLLVALLSNHR